METSYIPEGNKDSLPQLIVQEENPFPPATLVRSTSNLLCQDCQIMFSTSSKLKYHRLKNHGKWAKKIWTCGECQRSTSKATKFFSNQSNLNRHLRNSHQTGPLLHRHRKSVDEHLDLMGNEIPPKPSTLRCPYCPHSTWDAYNLRVHIRKHTGKRKGILFLFVHITIF